MSKSICLKPKMEKEYFIKKLVEYSVVICLLHLMWSELSVKSDEINYNFIVKLICSVQKFQNQFDIIQSFQRNSNDRLQSFFLILLKNFCVDSFNLDALIIRLVKMKMDNPKKKKKTVKMYDFQFNE